MGELGDLRQGAMRTSRGQGTHAATAEHSRTRAQPPPTEDATQADSVPDGSTAHAATVLDVEATHAVGPARMTSSTSGLPPVPAPPAPTRVPQTTTLVRTSPASSHRTNFRVRDLAIVRCVYKTLRSLCDDWPVRRVSGKREGRREKDRRTGLERSHSRGVIWVVSTTRRASKSSPTVSEAPRARLPTTTIIDLVLLTFLIGVACW